MKHFIVLLRYYAYALNGANADYCEFVCHATNISKEELEKELNERLGYADDYAIKLNEKNSHLFPYTEKERYEIIDLSEVTNLGKETKIYFQDHKAYGCLVATATSKEEAISLLEDEQHLKFDPSKKIQEFLSEPGIVHTNHGMDEASNIWLTSRFSRDTSLDEYIQKQREMK